MFPEIVRDEVFRLETRRLWLRWPTVADAFDGPTPKAIPTQGVEARLQVPGSACIEAWRAANERGEALHLVLEDKLSRSGIGSIHLSFGWHGHGMLDLRLAPARFCNGTAAEAVEAVVHATFLLRAASLITAKRAAHDACGRDALLLCGFDLVEADDRDDAACEGSATTDRFAIDRRRWVERQRMAAPCTPRAVSRAAPPPACWSMPA